VAGRARQLLPATSSSTGQTLVPCHRIDTLTYCRDPMVPLATRVSNDWSGPLTDTSAYGIS